METQTDFNLLGGVGNYFWSDPISHRPLGFSIPIQSSNPLRRSSPTFPLPSTSAAPTIDATTAATAVIGSPRKPPATATVGSGGRARRAPALLDALGTLVHGVIFAAAPAFLPRLTVGSVVQGLHPRMFCRLRERMAFLEEDKGMVDAYARPRDAHIALGGLNCET
ncbi:uncharacterized protein LOC125538537 [Triticum urartu]|uniref:uncharacterized protein LOC125538537 n=1 Tax=Triticum urartu TaxID=4572 RepID=UPI0020444193|nr:uncharacterized protein LOC125538537 [Triticum urartu]